MTTIAVNLQDVSDLPEAGKYTHLVLANKKFVGYLTVDEDGYHYVPSWTFTGVNDVIGDPPSGQFGMYLRHKPDVVYHAKTEDDMKALVKDVLAGGF